MTMADIILEVCVDSVESAIAAQAGGADRIELCGSLITGGLTPSPALFRAVKQAVDIPVRVMIRPRFGDFCYSSHEYEIMCEEVSMFCNMGADAIVSGCLTKNGEVDITMMQRLVKLAGSREFTFHRAFDVTKDPYKALDEIKALGIGTILTSGQKNSFVEGRELIKNLVHLAGDEVVIMAGAGVSPASLEQYANYVGARAYHMSGKVTLESSMKYRKTGISMGLPGLNEYEIWQTDEKTVRKARKILD